MINGGKQQHEKSKYDSGVQDCRTWEFNNEANVSLAWVAFPSPSPSPSHPFSWVQAVAPSLPTRHLTGTNQNQHDSYSWHSLFSSHEAESGPWPLRASTVLLQGIAQDRGRQNESVIPYLPHRFQTCITPYHYAERQGASIHLPLPRWHFDHPDSRSEKEMLKKANQRKNQSR